MILNELNSHTWQFYSFTFENKRTNVLEIFALLSEGQYFLQNRLKKTTAIKWMEVLIWYEYIFPGGKIHYTANCKLNELYNILPYFTIFIYRSNLCLSGFIVTFYRKMSAATNLNLLLYIDKKNNEKQINVSSSPFDSLALEIGWHSWQVSRFFSETIFARKNLSSLIVKI